MANLTAADIDCISSGGSVKLTPEGGIAVRIINGSGSASVKGTVVCVNNGNDNQFALQTNEFNAIGICYESGIANGSYAWIVVSGIADVLLQDTIGSTRDQVAICSPTDGRMITIATPTGTPTNNDHWK